MMLQLQFHYKAMVFCTAGQPLFSAHVNVLVDNTIQSACSSPTWLKYFIGICLKCSFEHMESHVESKAQSTAFINPLMLVTGRNL